ncbi:amidase [Polyangium jinanense]|uniref:amidase n=1 Tax=Polyangium jinanense TaxID=2829994 RepID=UPI0023412CB9|nr:amidase [Polyangium jinanense]MDC3960269.1 amidase [Polyangium jinanense]
MTYDLKTANAPRMTGLALEAAALALENPATGHLIGQKLLKDLGILDLRYSDLRDAPSVVPSLPRPASFTASAAPPVDLEGLARSAQKTKGFAFESAADFVAAYREGRADPVKVAERFLEAAQRLDTGERPLRVFIERNTDRLLAAARESRERYRKGAPKGPLDGVPVSVKDELDVEGYHTTVGTRFLKLRPSEDATTVRRLRSAGALILGKVNMHEIGIDTSGFNAHHGTPTNPYAPGHYTGGSSSGSAASVAAGFCPISIGADGGGSIRIPAALCGIVGLKATWSRISEHGAFPLCASVGHVGPLGATIRDVALAYALMAGPDAKDPNSLHQPPHHLDGLGREDLEGVRIGVYRPWFEHATPEIVRAAEGALDIFRARGARIVEIEIPELERARVAQGVTILCEMASCMARHDAEHRRAFGLGVRINLAMGRALAGIDYVQAQKVRTRFSEHLARVLQAVDVIVTPTTALTAPRIADDVFPRGESNLEVTSGLMRFVYPANLTGNPALSVPGGYDTSGHPIGIQILGRPWEEHLLLRMGEVLEREVPRKAPAIHVRLLDGA